MEVSLPLRIMDYEVTAESPVDELVTLGQILSEVGDYFSTVSDREHQSLARMCASKLDRVVEELTARQCIKSKDDLYVAPKSGRKKCNLAKMTVGELHSLYRGWPARHKKRVAEGREHLTYYFEGSIVRELLRREPANLDEQLKIDYCVATYRNELANLSFIFSLPVRLGDNKAYPSKSKQYTADELASMISLHKGYKDVEGREILIEYVDYALDWLANKAGTNKSPRLVAGLAELGRKKIIGIPKWIYQRS